MRKAHVIARFRLAGFAAGMAVAITAWAPAQTQPPADLILLNGKIITVDPQDTVAEAVAITAGRIVAVGRTADIKSRAGAASQVIDLGGRAMTPGLIDAHVHFTQVDSLFNVDLSTAKSIEEALAAVAARVAKAKPGEWIRGRGWDEGKFAERRYLTAADLDKVAPNNPVWLTQTTGHYGAANSYALKIAEVRSGTPDPPAGTIDRGAQGAPTGVMKEGAQGLVTRHMPPMTREQQKAGLVKMIEDFNREGMTGAKDPGIGEQKWELYKELLAEGRLTVRVFALWSGPTQTADAPAVLARVNANPRLPATLGDGMLTSGGVKMFMDGSGGARRTRDSCD